MAQTETLLLDNLLAGTTGGVVVERPELMRLVQQRRVKLGVVIESNRLVGVDVPEGRAADGIGHAWAGQGMVEVSRLVEVRGRAGVSEGSEVRGRAGATH